MDTGCWRGYVATWEIIDDFLCLVKIDTWIDDERADLQKLFSDLFHGGKVKSVWFSGKLRVPTGRMIRYVHSGYRSIFEKELFIEVEAGKVKGSEVIDNSNKEILEWDSDEF